MKSGEVHTLLLHEARSVAYTKKRGVCFGGADAAVKNVKWRKNEKYSNKITISNF